MKRLIDVFLHWCEMRAWCYRELNHTMKRIEIMALERHDVWEIYSEACRSLNCIGDGTPLESK